LKRAQQALDGLWREGKLLKDNGVYLVNDQKQRGLFDSPRKVRVR
jgi:hypothetical protein